MRHHRVWFELGGQHSDTLRDFYAELLGWQDDDRSAPSPRAAASTSASLTRPCSPTASIG